MKFLAILFKILGYIWLCAASLLIAAGIIGVFLKEGFSGVQDLMSPFNVLNYLLIMITLAPGIGLVMLSEKIQP